MWHYLERSIKSLSSIKAWGDVVARGVFDCGIKSQLLIVT